MADRFPSRPHSPPFSPFLLILSSPSSASESAESKFKANAQVAATRDAKRALRESGYYETHELDMIDDDEKHGHKIM
jgi:hypothetical protein